MSNVCTVCSDQGWELVVGKGVRACSACEKTRWLASARFQEMLRTIPAKHRHMRLEELTPRVHPLDQKGMQARAIKDMKNNPARSYLFYGPAGVGKTGLAYALVRRAMEDKRQVYHCTASDLLRSFQSSAIAHVQEFLPVEKITGEHPMTFLIDDFDKATVRGTPFRAEMLLQVMDAIWRHEHQLIITAQIQPQALDHCLLENFGVAHGLSITRRLKEACQATTVNFFPEKT